jgi:hypothetical protein
LITVELLVLPELQANEVAPVPDAVRVMDAPWTTVADGLAVMLTIDLLSVTVAVAELKQPLAATPVTEYVPTVVALNVLLVVLLLQVYVLAPLAVSKTDGAWQMLAGLGLMLTVGLFSVMVAVAVLKQPLPSTPVTEYVPAVVALNVLSVVLLLQMYVLAPLAVSRTDLP